MSTTPPVTPAPTPVIMTDIQKLPVKWGAVDADGNPTTNLGGGTIAYSVSPSTAGTHAADPSDSTGLSSIFTPNPAPGNLGTFQLQALATGGSLPAAGVSGVLAVTVNSSAAVSLAPTAGTPA